MNIYLGRWNNAKKLAEKYNQYFDKGYIAMLDDEFVEGNFEITETEVWLKLDDRNKVLFFNYDLDADDGCYTTIKDMKEIFKELKFYKQVKVR